MNVTMIYFSQTGNTRHVAEAMAEAFRQAGHSARLVPLNKATPQDATTGDLLGVGTPCFSSQAPTPVKTFLNALPALPNRRAFVFATSGGEPGIVLYDMARVLQAKGAEVVGGFLARGALHHPAPCMIGRFANRPDADDLARARRFGAAIAEHVSAGRSGLVAASRPDTLRSKRDFYALVAALSTDGFLRLVLPEPKLTSSRCNQCGWCARECPLHNITLEPYPVLGSQCIRCYRCLTGCPQKALEANWWLGNLAILTFYNTTFVRWFGDLAPGEQIYARK